MPNGWGIGWGVKPKAIPKNKYPPLVGGSKSLISRRGQTYAKNKSQCQRQNNPSPAYVAFAQLKHVCFLSLLDYSGCVRSKVRPAPYGFRFAPPYRKSATRGEEKTNQFPSLRANAKQSRKVGLVNPTYITETQRSIWRSEWQTKTKWQKKIKTNKSFLINYLL